ncbi:MAG: sensor histidine kinase [Spirochaetota bacterium]
MDHLIFVVDTDGESRTGIAALLERFGRVETASSTEDALRRLKEGLIADLLVCDADEISVDKILERANCGFVLRASAETVSRLSASACAACYGLVQKTADSDAFLLATVEAALERADRDHETAEDKEAYRFFFDNLPVAAIVCSPDYVIQQWNRGAEALFGYTRGEAVGHQLMTLIYSEKNEMGPDELRDWLKNTLHENQRSRNTNYDRTKDGRNLLCEWFDLPYTADDRAHILSVATDVTKERELLTTLKKTIEQKDFLMQEMYHRLKNNLNLIISLISLKIDELEAAAGAGDTPGSGVEYPAATESLNDIMQKISAFSVLYDMLHQYGGGVRTVDLGRYLEELLHTIFSTMAASRCRVESDLADVEVAPQTAIVLGLITNEIATNALKYGFRAEGRETFSVSLSPDYDNGRCEYTLSNTGNPFPEDVDLTNTSSLGLQLINSLVDQLNATVELEKRPSTRYTISFPMDDVRPSEAERTATV